MPIDPRYQVETDGRTVWVNGDDGACWGRFSRFGIDVHKKGKDQHADGDSCLDCVPGEMDWAGWEHFKASMLHHHDVTVTDHHAPQYLERPADFR
jgi:hypothetical protein